MARSVTLFKLVTLIASLAISNVATATVKHSIGVARNADDSVRYIEHHQYFSDGRHSIRYFNPDYELLVKKDIRYPELPQHPIIRQSDLKAAMETLIEQRGDEATITRTSTQTSDTFTFPLTENTVIDAGFDAFIRSNFDSLRQGETTRLEFAVPGQRRLLGMNLNFAGATEGLNHFIIEPASWLVRLIIPSINLYYNENRQLVQYQGFSNLKPAPGESRQVRIDFEHYESVEMLELPTPQWLKEALAG